MPSGAPIGSRKPKITLHSAVEHFAGDEPWLHACTCMECHAMLSGEMTILAASATNILLRPL